MRSKRLDVLVVGAGITGLSTAKHLLDQGIRGIAVAGLGRDGMSDRVAGYAAGGQLDNFTRLSHAHGMGLAAGLWALGDKAYDRFVTYCRASGVQVQEGGRLRLIVTEDERAEAEKAVKALSDAGFGATLDHAPDHESYGLTSRVLAVQDDGPRGAWIDAAALLRVLRADLEKYGRSSVTSLTTGADGVRAILEDGSELLAEIAVIATHLAIGELVPNLAEALVSFADQWSECRFDPSLSGRMARPGTVFSAHHTYEWGVVRSDSLLHAGGGRYLRPLAGIEAREAIADDKIAAHVTQQVAKTFAGGVPKPVGQPVASLGCRPCDELPIIGPMFGEDRILVATGYMGQGLTLGFEAGYQLACLIKSGRADGLPRQLWPERLRSLSR